jgi:hypothetical protein
LIPRNLIFPLTNTTIPEQGSLVYLGSLNVEKGILPTTLGLFNISVVSSSLIESDLIYSNGNSEILSVIGSG